MKLSTQFFAFAALLASALFLLAEPAFAQSGFTQAQAQGTALFNFIVWAIRIICIVALAIIGAMVALDKTDWTSAGKVFIGVLIAGAATEIVNAVWGNPTT